MNINFLIDLIIRLARGMIGIRLISFIWTSLTFCCTRNERLVFKYISMVSLMSFCVVFGVFTLVFTFDFLLFLREDIDILWTCLWITEVTCSSDSKSILYIFRYLHNNSLTEINSGTFNDLSSLHLLWVS